MDFITPIIKAAEQANPPKDGDYEQDGILYCGKCHTQKQCVITFFGAKRKVPCSCHCEQEAYYAEKKRERENDRRMYIKRLRANGLHDKTVAGMRFDADDGGCPDIMDKARRYVTAWERMHQENIGLLLWGNTGNGKTFAAACIANALIDMGEPVLMTSFPRLLGTLGAMYNDDRTAYLDSLENYRLLIIDDLGAERDSSYALEQVYNVIDSRYRSHKPLIVTTNLPIGEIRHAKDMTYQRIYDRVLEMCVPVKADGESRRKGIAFGKMQTARELLGGET